ncbi:large neutral amino acids transporter small subunit 1-like [Macrosteles quadrilineatus]|nr:large neutral amino acids transporter small subunit 1-like [Macrosteles quadrilineatus]
MMLCTSDIYALITYSSFVESFFIMLSVSGILWLRYKRPNIPRPIKVSVWIPIFFIIICLFLVFLPIYYKPLEVAVAVAITLTGVPAYFIGVRWTNKPQWFHQAHQSMTYFVQKLFMSAKEHVEEDDD